MTINATQVRVGMIIVHERDLYRVTAVHHLTPGNKRGFVQTKLKSLRTGVGTEQKFRSEDRLEQATLESRAMAYLYRDGDYHIFMDAENYEQIPLRTEEVGEELLSYLLPGQTVQIEFFDGRSVGIFPPSSVVLEVKETQPTLKGATASASYKPATVETGLTIPVPLFVQVGDRIRVDTYDGKYLERVS
jgi:elongation factor P